MYVFTRVGATWTQQAYLKASNVQGSDRFGFTVAVSGDTIAVGAPGEDSWPQESTVTKPTTHSSPPAQCTCLRGAERPGANKPT
ncbi:MAG: FG-GAP repeat protein [Sandaracinaceae bacterium]|nr:FG-GAP repeat protein [Sandaracinaceae bacterium]